MLKVALGRCLKVSKGIDKDANFWISAYMILMHVVGLSIASRFLQIGW